MLSGYPCSNPFLCLYGHLREIQRHSWCSHQRNVHSYHFPWFLKIPSLSVLVCALLSVPVRKSPLTGCMVRSKTSALCDPCAALERSSDSLLSLETHFSYLQGKYSDCCLLPPWRTISIVPCWLQTWLIPLTTLFFFPPELPTKLFLWSFSNMFKSNGGGLL